MENDFWNGLNKEWQQLLQINYLFETKSPTLQRGKYNVWTTPFENYKNLIGSIEQKPKIEQNEILKKLTKIDIYGTEIVDVTPLASLPNLKEFYCGSTDINDLEPIAKSSNLEKLCCYNTLVSDINPLTGLLNLKRLCLSKSNISDIAPLKYLQKLEKLAMYRTNVRDLSPLVGHTNLIKLNINYTLVENLAPLYSLVNLKELHCYDTKASDSEIKQLETNLPSCRIISDHEVPESEYDDFE